MEAAASSTPKKQKSSLTSKSKGKKGRGRANSNFRIPDWAQGNVAEASRKREEEAQRLAQLQRQAKINDWRRQRDLDREVKYEKYCHEMRKHPDIMTLHQKDSKPKDVVLRLSSDGKALEFGIDYDVMSTVLTLEEVSHVVYGPFAKVFKGLLERDELEAGHFCFSIIAMNREDSLHLQPYTFEVLQRWFLGMQHLIRSRLFAANRPIITLGQFLLRRLAWSFESRGMSLSRFFRAAVAKVLAENKQTLEKTEVWKPMLQYKLKRKETPPGAPPQYEELGGELVSVPRNHYVPKPFEAASEILRCWQAFDSDENGLVDREEFAKFFLLLGEKNAYRSEHLNSLWDSFDQTGDGLLVFDEFVSVAGAMFGIEELRTVGTVWKRFNMYKRNADGKVDREGVRKVYVDLEGREMSDRLLDIFFDGLDADGDGLIDWAEFLTGAFTNSTAFDRYHTHPRSGELVMMIFQNIDSNYDNKISQEELTDFLRQIGLPTDPDRISKLFQFLDSGHNGSLEYFEFLRLSRILFENRHLEELQDLKNICKRFSQNGNLKRDSIEEILQEYQDTGYEGADVMLKELGPAENISWKDFMLTAIRCLDEFDPETRGTQFEEFLCEVEASVASGEPTSSS